MNVIIPYKKIEKNTQSFIRPDGKFLYVEKSHEEFAKYYCENYLRGKEIDIYEKWLEICNPTKKEIYADFLIKTLSYDKINTKIINQIVTSSLLPHIRFYNYYLMDYKITIFQKIIYDQIKQDFIERENLYVLNSFLDEETEEEIENIKSKTLVLDRYNYLK